MKLILSLCLIGVFNFVGFAQVSSSSINIKRDSGYKEKVIRHDHVIINVPVGWKLFSEAETNNIKKSLRESTGYDLPIDYYLSLTSEVDYPNINITIRKAEEFKQLTFDQFKDYFKQIYQATSEVLLDGTKSVMTDYVNKDFIVDSRNNRFFVVNEALVANVGVVRTIGAMILMDEYMVNINFCHTLDEFNRYESALRIMANSVRKLGE